LLCSGPQELEEVGVFIVCVGGVGVIFVTDVTQQMLQYGIEWKNAVQLRAGLGALARVELLLYSVML
jgi:hypothetical protein